MRFLAPLSVASSNIPSSHLFVASPLSVSSRFRSLPHFLTLAVGCAMPSVLSVLSPPLRISIELLTPTCPVSGIEVRFRGLPRYRILTVVVTSVVIVCVLTSPYFYLASRHPSLSYTRRGGRACSHIITGRGRSTDGQDSTLWRTTTARTTIAHIKRNTT